MLFLGPAPTTGSGITDLDDMKRHTVITPKANMWYYTSNWGAVTGAALTLNRMDVTPWAVTTFGNLAVTRFGFNVSTAGAAGAVGRVVLYGDDGSGYPGSLLYDSGQIAATTTGVKETTTGITLSFGLYWIGIVAQVATFSTTQSNGSGSWNALMPYVLNSTTTTVGAATGQTHAYGHPSVTGAAPSTFTASPTLGIGQTTRILFRT